MPLKKHTSMVQNNWQFVIRIPFPGQQIRSLGPKLLGKEILITCERICPCLAMVMCVLKELWFLLTCCWPIGLRCLAVCQCPFILVLSVEGRKINAFRVGWILETVLQNVWTDFFVHLFVCWWTVLSDTGGSRCHSWKHKVDHRNWKNKS